MRKSAIAASLAVITAVVVFQNCGGFHVSNDGQVVVDAAPQPTPTSYPGNLTRGFNANLHGANILPLTVGSCGFNVPNSACVSVTICMPGTSNCQTIPNIQLSTFDSGLRLFKQAVTLPLPSVTVSGSSLAECDQNTSNPLWGPLKNADVKLGGEPVVNTSIQIIDSTFGSLPSGCDNVATSPSTWGANGTLGIGLGAYDCGPSCANSASNDIYYACSGAGCSPTTVSIHNQVANPVWLLPVDNNGVAITLPGLATHSGSTIVTGSLILGIGTEANNTPISAVALTTDDGGWVHANINGQTFPALFEIYNNLSYFPNETSLPACTQSASWQPYYCPASEQQISVTFTNSTSTTSLPSSISVGNAYNESNSSANHVVWDDVGLASTSNVILGAGFFFDKTVYVGIVTMQSPLGIGPYYAF